MNRPPPGRPPFPPRHPGGAPGHPQPGQPRHPGQMPSGQPAFDPRRPPAQPYAQRPGGPGGQGPGGRRPPPPRKKTGPRIGSVLFSVILFIVVIVGGAIAYLTLNPPSDLIRQTIVEQVKQRTGRDLVIAGPAAFTFWPGVGVSLDGVSLSGPPGSAEPVATMRALNVSVQTLPLLQQKIVVDRLTLDQPVFDLKVDKQGRRNWDFATSSQPLRFAADATSADGKAELIRIAGAANQAGRAAKLDALRDLQLSDVTIRDGTVRYADARSGARQQLTGINVSAALPGIYEPMRATGNVAHRGQKLNFDATLSTVADVLSDKPASLNLSAENALASFAYKGKITVSDGVDLSGGITVDTPSARRAAEWLGTRLPPVAGFGPMSIKGKVKTAGNVTRLDDTTFRLDETNATGTVVVTTGGARPYVKADLQIASLNLNDYLTAAAGGTIATEPGKANGANPTAAPEDEIEKLLKKSDGPTRVYGSVQRAGWSSEQLNLALLGIADVDAKLATGPLRIKKLLIDRSEANVSVKNRAMRTNFTRLDLYDGRGNGNFSVNGANNTAAVTGKFQFDAITARNFLRDASDIDWLSGKANVALDLAARGASQLQLVETLNGTGNVSIADGAIVGFNVAGAVRNLTQGNFSGLRRSDREKTDFSALTAGFQISNGIARNNDLSMLSPLLRVTGAGQINLPARTVDYTARPKLVASLEGQGAESPLSGLEIPVRITGSLDNPRFQPDLGGVLKNPEKAVEAVQEIGKRLKGKDSGEIMDELFGSGESDTKSKAKDLLNRFLNKN